MAKFGSQISVIATSWLIIVSSWAFPSSFSSLWLLIHQTQIFFLLLITGAHIPNDVQNVITGTSYALFPYAAIPFNKNKSLTSFIDNFNFDLSDDVYKPLDLKSDSTVVNTYSLIILILTIALIHISAVCLMKKLADRWDSSGRWSKWMKIPKWIVNKVSSLMTFDYYIRTFISSNQFLLVCSIYEINRHDITAMYRAISFGYACLILGCWILGNILILWLSVTINPQVKEEDDKFRELFKGIKTHKKERFHVGVSILRRTIFIAALICLKFCSFGILVGSLWMVQLSYLSWIIFVRPYSEVKSNIIEITNEIYLLLCLGV